MKVFFLAGIITLLLNACVPIAQQGNYGTADATYFADKKFRTIDFIYEEDVKTVLLFPKLSQGADEAVATLQTPVIPLVQSNPLMLEFDQLGSNFKSFRAKIYHCDADWSLSLLNDMEFVESFNDFLITDYQLSFNTKVPYVHYTFEVPRVKITGNYVLMVYREGNVKDIILTRRFMVYENRVSITSDVGSSTGVSERNLNQQLNFTINYPSHPLANPRETVKVVIRQNYKWNNAIRDLKPTSIREDLQVLEYEHFNLENNFAGGNEFRFFDMRSIRFLGQNMGKVNVAKDSTDVYLLMDKPRTKQPYAQTIDFNGRFVIDNYETNRGDVEADYVDVHFSLKVPEKAPGPVHVWGAFMDWLPNEKTLMTYNEALQTYTAEILLKQGYYNYMYVLVSPDNGKQERDRINETYFEGSFFNTENAYEIIVYYRPLGARTDRIIGYDLIEHNKRR